MRMYMFKNAPDTVDEVPEKDLIAWGWKIMDFDPETGNGVAFHNDMNLYEEFSSHEEN